MTRKMSVVYSKHILNMKEWIKSVQLQETRLAYLMLAVLIQSLLVECCVSGLDDDMRVDIDMDERNGNKSDSDSDGMSSRRTTVNENGYQQPVETPYVENPVEELGQVCQSLRSDDVDHQFLVFHLLSVKWR